MESPAAISLWDKIPQPDKCPYVNYSKLPSILLHLDSIKALYVGYMPSVHCAHKLNVSEAPHSILTSVVSDFEESKKPGLKRAPERTRDVFHCGQDPNSIIATPVVPKVETLHALRTADAIYFHFL